MTIHQTALPLYDSPPEAPTPAPNPDPVPAAHARRTDPQTSHAAAKTMPMEARSLSKRWLTERGLASWDDGDVP